jgi:hypothetical protein
MDCAGQGFDESHSAPRKVVGQFEKVAGWNANQFRRHEVADANVGHSGTDCDDFAAELVPWNDRVPRDCEVPSNM